MTVDLRGALLRSTAIAVFAFGGASAAIAATSNGVTVNGGGSTLAGPGYEAIFASDGLKAVPSSGGSSTCPANGSTTAYDIYFGFVGSGAGATGFITNNSTLIGCGGNGLPDDYGAGDLPIANNYANGSSVFKSTYGYQMIQVPAFGTPVTIPFNLSGKTTNGSLKLTDAELCNIFSGAVQSWSGISGSGSTGAIGISYRQDSSGTSFLLTNHLAAVCPKPVNGITFAGTTRFATLFAGYSSFPCSNPANTCNKVPSGTFAADDSAQGSGGVQAAIDNNVNSVGYLSPDYTKIAKDPVGTPPPVASVNNKLPTETLVAAALKTQSTSGTSATNPDSFGFLIPNPKTGYPIVGYTYLYVSSCYATQAKVSVISTFLDSLYNSNGSYTGAYNDIVDGGYVPVPGTKASAKPGASTLAGLIVKDYLAKNAVVPIAYSTGAGAKCSNGR